MNVIMFSSKSLQEELSNINWVKTFFTILSKHGTLVTKVLKCIQLNH